MKARIKLDKLGPDCYYIVKEAMALRGIADVIGWYKGVPFAWELKRSHKISEGKRDGFELQKYNLVRGSRAGGLCRLVYPENFEECYNELIKTAADREALTRPDLLETIPGYSPS